MDVTAESRTTVADDCGDPARVAWTPRWTVDVGNGCSLGIAIDDGCFVVLYHHGDSWRPGKHIPKAVAVRISELLAFAD
jgi:hypothetical protein